MEMQGSSVLLLSNVCLARCADRTDTRKEMLCRRDGLLCSNSSGLRTIPEQQRRRRQQDQQQQYPQQSRQAPQGGSGLGTTPSEDTLLNHGVDFERVDSGETLVDRHNKQGNSQDENIAVQTERRRSYGIGGAGNMRMQG